MSDEPIVVVFGNGAWIAQCDHGISRSIVSAVDAVASRRRADRAVTSRDRERTDRVRAGRRAGA